MELRGQILVAVALLPGKKSVCPPNRKLSGLHNRSERLVK